MSNATKFLLTCGALALTPAAFAGGSIAGDWGGHHGSGHRGGHGTEFFEQFDADQDGRLTQPEIDQVRQSRLGEFDQNGDGSLTIEEYQALWLDAMRERMVDRFQAHDDDGDGTITPEEFGEPFDRMVSGLDQNGDGALTPDELHRRGDDRGGEDADGDEGDRAGGEGGGGDDDPEPGAQEQDE